MNNERTRVRPHRATALLALSCGFYVAMHRIPSHSSMTVMDASLLWADLCDGVLVYLVCQQLVTHEFHTHRSPLFNKSE